MQYFVDSDQKINISACSDRNMGLLEMFYLQHRLNKRFTFEFFGEKIQVRFQEPISIPKVEGNTGIISTLELVLIETPYDTAEKESIYEPH